MLPFSARSSARPAAALREIRPNSDLDDTKNLPHGSCGPYPPTWELTCCSRIHEPAASSPTYGSSRSTRLPVHGITVLVLSTSLVSSAESNNIFTILAKCLRACTNFELFTQRESSDINGEDFAGVPGSLRRRSRREIFKSDVTRI